MGFEITTHATVGPNGHLEVDLPQLAEGQRVELVVRPELLFRKGYGGMAGAIGWIGEDFDDPIEEFAEYS